MGLIGWRMVHISKGDYQNFKASVIDIIFWISSTPTPIPTLILVYSFWIYFSPPILGLGRQNINILTAVEISFSSVQLLWLCLTLCNPVDCSMPGLSVHHRLLEFTQIHVHWVDAAIQPSHHLLSPSPPTSKLSQHKGLFKWVSSSHQVAKVL